MDLEVKFQAAAKNLPKFVEKLSPDRLLEFYGLYKQATIGPCNTPMPVGWFDAQARLKWNKWKGMGNMSTEEAMSSYVEKMHEVLNDYTDMKDIDDFEDLSADQMLDANSPSKWYSSSSLATSSGSRGWVSVSRFANTEEELADEDKTFLDWVKDGDDEMVEKLLRYNPLLAKEPDKNGMYPIHWAADRNHPRVIECLLKAGVDINLTDNRGDSAIHYAKNSLNFDLADTLVRYGAEDSDDTDQNCDVVITYVI